MLSLHSLVGALAVSLTIPSFAADLDRGAEIFAANCAACHGAAGSPDPESPLVKNLGVVPADFSDTLFNSREGETEWKLVATHGGASLGFSEVMPAFGGSLSEEDIDNTLAYIKTLGGEHDYPDGSLNL
ncbi:MAG: c-type cytochrome, partial [Oceanisphaera sp.]|nr:c-type cytochrome [Oceanisphaera sp.]